ncbi:MAG: MYXO-CTERM sorting domain-containing protein, partial [Phycisphaerales bacterium]
GSSHAALVAYWNNNSNALPVSGFGYTSTAFPQAADAGSGFMTIGGGIMSETVVNANGTVYTWAQSFGGSDLNALNGDAAGGSFSIQGGTANGNNGAYLQFQLDMSGFTGLDISYATRGTSTGFSSQAWSWSTDGVNFTTFETVTGTNNSTFSVKTLATLSAVDGAATAFLRVTFDGAASSTGNNRLDNMQFNATAIPAPGAVALVGLAGLVTTRRRK